MSHMTPAIRPQPSTLSDPDDALDVVLITFDLDNTATKPVVSSIAGIVPSLLEKRKMYYNSVTYGDLMGNDTLSRTARASATSQTPSKIMESMLSEPDILSITEMTPCHAYSGLLWTLCYDAQPHVNWIGAMKLRDRWSQTTDYLARHKVHTAS